MSESWNRVKFALTCARRRCRFLRGSAIPFLGSGSMKKAHLAGDADEWHECVADLSLVDVDAVEMVCPRVDDDEPDVEDAAEVVVADRLDRVDLICGECTEVVRVPGQDPPRRPARKRRDRRAIGSGRPRARRPSRKLPARGREARFAEKPLRRVAEGRTLTRKERPSRSQTPGRCPRCSFSVAVCWR